MDALRTGPRVRAPELRAGRWFGTEPLRLDALRGRFLLLDFWTSACANCLHVVPELHRLERQFADILTVVGVHSPKFPGRGRRWCSSTRRVTSSRRWRARDMAAGSPS